MVADESLYPSEIYELSDLRVVTEHTLQVHWEFQGTASVGVSENKLYFQPFHLKVNSTTHKYVFGIFKGQPVANIYTWKYDFQLNNVSRPERFFHSIQLNPRNRKVFLQTGYFNRK